ncbi:apolipoprotein N-acyltransferase [Shimia sp.]|jgi:apolipoprotein N-acyltransferase|uniref:apolipoprotein N-acyltransferase n=1 Tax=unclassified Shimia TaxID=2630038 RepID=UPI0025EEF67B|nr:apolipoprotein N-acyltransferase [Shimia sp.]MCH2069186.1 apolipoprotein N-acyltransferase [Shimia sp.]
MADGALRRRLRAIPWKTFCTGGAVGLIAALGHPPFDLWFLSLFGFAAAFAMLRLTASGFSDAVFGLGFGTGYFALSLSWIVEPFLVDPLVHGWMAPFAILFLSMGLALFWALAFWGAKRLSTTGWAVILTLTLAELVRAYVFTGFPWAMPSYVLVNKLVAQSAAVVGPHGLNLVLFITAWLLAQALVFGGRIGFKISAAVLGFVVLAMPLSGADPQAQADRPVVRLIQPNAPQHQKWDPQYAGLFFERLVQFTRAGDDRPDLIVWPETAVPVWLHNAANTLNIISGAAGDVPVVLGINRAEGLRIFNAAVLMDKDGRVTQTYDKHHLVPFGEYIPLGDLLSKIGIQGLASRNGDGFSPGAGAVVLDLGALGKALVLICYEAVFPQDVRAAPERPSFILHLTNDAWFGNFSGPYQHLDQARMRAIESGLPVLRSANTGVSAVIDARGRVLDALALNTEGYLDAVLPEARAKTLYAKTGDLPLTIVVVLLLLTALLLRRRETH